ncbi:hypothetical protein K1719_005397 [Acacia pycnantha]|nr:hypothetical protein K1719_005397 [Acacia pycnantha]
MINGNLNTKTKKKCSRKSKAGVDENAPLLPKTNKDVEVGFDDFNGASFSGAVLNLSTTIIGAGIMALPASLRELGLVPGILAIIFMVFLTEKSIKFMVRFMRAVKFVSYGGLIGNSFGNFGKYLAQITIIVNNIGVLIVYIIILGDVLSGTSSSGDHHKGVLEGRFGVHWWTGRTFVVLFTTLAIFAPLVFINSGILLGCISRLPLWLGWRLMLGVGVVPSVLIALGVFEQEAQQRLADIKLAAGISESCNDDIVEVINKQKSGKGVWKEMFITATPAVRHIIVAVISIHFFQQAVGLDSVVLYSPTIFEKAGITSDSQKLLATVAVGVTKTIFILVATFLLDRFGRRPLLITSFGGLIASLLLSPRALRSLHTQRKE